jgi:hypothetical protein
VAQFKGKRSESKNQRVKLRNAQRKRDNLQRMAEVVHRSPAEQLRVLDDRLGKGKGATRERAKLLAKLNGKKDG